jgi:hypothetical protein
MWIPLFRVRALAGFITRFLAHLGATETVETRPPSTELDPTALTPLHRSLLAQAADLEFDPKGLACGVQFRFTPLGAWLLGDAPEPEWPTCTPLELTLAPDGDSWLRVELPAHPNSLHRVRLEPFADWERGHYLLTPASFNRARGRGATLEALLGLLEEATAASLPPAVRQALRAWERSGVRMTLSRPALLECDDPAILGQLARKRRFRNYIVRTLSSRALVLDDAHLGAALRHLRREGHDPRVLLPLEETGQAPAASPGRGLAGRSAAAFHWLAGQVYRGLARFVQLPAAYPSSAFDELAKTLPPAELAAAEAGAGRVLEALASALDGWAPHPSQVPGLDPEAIRPQIEAAIRDDKALRITYWTAGRGALTQRTVTPYRLERRGRTLYMVAYCHQAQDERVFRLDRVRELEVVDKPRYDLCDC